MAHAAVWRVGIVFVTFVDLDNDMHEVQVGRKGLLLALRWLRIARHDRDDDGVHIGADQPKVKIGHATILIAFHTFFDSPLDFFGALFIEQDAARVSQESPRPPRT